MLTLFENRKAHINRATIYQQLTPWPKSAYVGFLFRCYSDSDDRQRQNDPHPVRRAKGPAHACDLAAELRRRARKLTEAAPKLRAKGAKAALQPLLDQDSLAAATPIAGLSQRGTRRLLLRLAALGAIRELTGRATFRLHGL